MTERVYSEREARDLAVEAAQEALRLYSAKPLKKPAYTLVEAAGILGVSSRTVARMNLKKNAAGKIPYEVLLDAMRPR